MTTNLKLNIWVDDHLSQNPDARFIEILGHYNPRTNPETFDIDENRLGHWVGRGARPSDTVRTLLSRSRKRESVQEAEAASS